MIHVTSVTVSPKNVKIKPGEWYENLNATVLPANADKPCVAWTSSNENVVSVSSFSGAVYGVGLGTAVVYATSIDGTNITDCCTFTVTNNIPITNLALDKTSLSMQLNENRTLSATFLPANATNKALTWCSDNTNVVTVNNGTLSPVSTGNAVVTAYTNDGSNLSASCAVNITTNTLVRCITVSDETLSLVVGESKYITAEVCPTDAKNKNVIWTSSNPSVATVNPTSGLINAISAGSTLITATAADGSGATASCSLTVIPYVHVESVSTFATKALDKGDTLTMTATVCPFNATDSEVIWSSDNTEVAQINSSTGVLCALKAGIANITVKSKSNPSLSDTCEVWVRGKKAVFLLHGRDSNSAITWGAVNNIFYDNSEFENRQFCPNVNATTENNNKSYTSVTSQRITSQTTNLVSGDSIIQDYTLPGVFDGKFDKGNYSNVPHPEGANLAYMLSNCGYTENINLFVFNYPSIDAIMHSAKKFEKYIENLIEYIRESNRDSMKTCFYTSRQAYDNNYYTFNIVAHSMGGLVSRYYIENLDQDKRVDKLITICTPHWGSRYANLSNSTSIQHCLCDHDLDTGSAMFGNDTGSVLSNGCSLWDIDGSYDCTTTSYYITDALQYSKERHTKYYAIAGIDYNATTFDENDHMLSLPTTFTTFEEIEDFMENEQIYKQLVLKSHIDIKKVGDNTVGLLSQIGWTDDNQETPTKRINMEKIVIDVDTNGGNGGEIFIWEMINDLGEHILHSKIPHREAVCQKVIEFLGE